VPRKRAGGFGNPARTFLAVQFCCNSILVPPLSDSPLPPVAFIVLPDEPSPLASDFRALFGTDRGSRRMISRPPRPSIATGVCGPAVIPRSSTIKQGHAFRYRRFFKTGSCDSCRKIAFRPRSGLITPAQLGRLTGLSVIGLGSSFLRRREFVDHPSSRRFHLPARPCCGSPRSSPRGPRSDGQNRTHIGSLRPKVID